ncbi:uncharacterized protein LOC120426716 [Culex pipiens pallens]|uniref:uncharacterized protein LOC120426716 n=1 Tax=Culex pipiens pallens TaxID=42434 RepID=UPI001954C1DD|nr:uncharacterized protein LOC120426716 [Culex pipiens pallens]XP_052562398.1 uncharacterized protein LOC120426716 [Culex pipiens pallens]
MIFSRLTGSSCNQLIRVPPLPDDPLQLLHLHTVTGKPVSTFFLAYGDHIVENSSMNKTVSLRKEPHLPMDRGTPRQVRICIAWLVRAGHRWRFCPAGKSANRCFFKTLSRSLNNESKLDVTFLDIRSQSKSNWSKKFSARLAPRSDIFFVLWKRHVTDQRPESGPWTVDALREGQ